MRPRRDFAVVFHGNFSEIPLATGIAGHVLFGIAGSLCAVTGWAWHIPQVRHAFGHVIAGDHHKGMM